MSDLNTKFDGVRQQLAEQHDDTQTALNAILTALGAPPPAPGATLADVLGALNQIAVQLAGLRLDMSSQHAAQLAELQTIGVTLDIINNNASYNTQQMLLGLAQLDPCKSCELPTYELPPLLVSPIVVNQEHCAKMQALIFALLRFTIKLDLISSLGAGFNTNTISGAFDEILTELNTAQSATINLPSFNELLQIVAACVQYVAANIFGSYSLQSSFVSIKNDLLMPLYNATNAEAGRAAYRAFIDSTTLPNPVKAVLTSIGYISLFNLYYSDAEINTTGFDGTICAPAEIFPPVSGCIVLDSVAGITRSDNVVSQFIVWPSGGTNALPSTVRPAGFDTITASDSIWYVGNLQGYYLRSSVSMTVYINPSGDNRTIHLDANTYQQVTSSTSYVEAGFWDAFTLEICASLPS